MTCPGIKTDVQRRERNFKRGIRLSRDRIGCPGFEDRQLTKQSLYPHRPMTLVKPTNCMLSPLWPRCLATSRATFPSIFHEIKAFLAKSPHMLTIGDCQGTLQARRGDPCVSIPPCTCVQYPHKSASAVGNLATRTGLCLVSATHTSSSRTLSMLSGCMGAWSSDRPPLTHIDLAKPWQWRQEDEQR